MKTLTIRSLAAAVALAAALAANAQDTNALKTALGLFEARPGVLLLKGMDAVGSIPLGAAQLSLGCKQTRDVGSGQKVYGLIVQFDAPQLPRQTVLLDDDEVGSLLNAITYLVKLNSTATAQGGFEASYCSKAGLQVVADCLRKDGGILSYVQFEDYPRVPLTAVQMSQFANLIQQGEKDLEILKSAR